MDIKPGTTIALEITAIPRRTASVKTLRRLCAKDPAIMRAHKKYRANRPSWEEWIRGGYLWHHQMKSQPAATIERGSVFTIRATVDVLRDLASIKGCVKVTPK
jgi:hypothetical protein